MNVGFVTTRLFAQPRSGGELCTARLLAEIEHAGHRVHLIGRGPAQSRAGAVSVGALVPAFDQLPAARQMACLVGALASGQACTVQRQARGGAAERVGRWLARPGPAPLDVLVLDHLQAWPWPGLPQPGQPAPMLVMHNLESEDYTERARALAAGGAGSRLRRAVLQREARLLAQLETRALRSASVVACLSDADAACLRRKAAACGATVAIEVLPGFPLRAAAGRSDLARSSTPPLPAPPLLRRPPAAPALCRIGMIGTWTWGPNRAALQWVLDSVLPHLPVHCRLVLAGTGLAGTGWPPPVECLGPVADVQALYGSVDVVALPSLAGSGVQEKAIEAIACGRPVVATAHALRGLGPDLPGHVAVADGPLQFARLCASADAWAWPAADAAGTPSVRDWADERQRRYRQALQRCLQAAAAGRNA